MSKRSASVLLIVAITTAIVISATPATAGTASDEARFVSKINAARAADGRGSLRMMSDLTSLARKQSARMAARGEIFHNPHLASDVAGNWTDLGENVGAGPDTDSLHQAFMDSPEHRANILDKAFNQVGVGIVMGSDGTMYVTEVFAKRGVPARVVRVTHVTRPRARTHHSAARAHTASAVQQPVAEPVAPAASSTGHGDAQSVDLLARIVGM